MGNTIKQTLEEDASENSENTNQEHPKTEQSLSGEKSADIPQGDLEEKPPSAKSAGQLRNCSLKQLIDGCIEEKHQALCVEGSDEYSEQRKETGKHSPAKEENAPAQNLKSLQYKEAIDYLIEGYLKPNKFPSKVMLHFNSIGESSAEIAGERSESEIKEDVCEVTADRTDLNTVSKPVEMTDCSNLLVKIEESNSVSNNVTDHSSGQTVNADINKQCYSGKKVLNINAIIDQVIDNSLTQDSGSPDNSGISLSTHIDETQKCSRPSHVAFPKLSAKNDVKPTRKSEGNNGFLSLKDHIDSILQKSLLEDDEISSDNEKKGMIPKILPLVDDNPHLDLLLNKHATKSLGSTSVSVRTSKPENGAAVCVTGRNVPCNTQPSNFPTSIGNAVARVVAECHDSYQSNADCRGKFRGPNTNCGVTRRESSEFGSNNSKEVIGNKMIGQQREMKKLLEIPTTHSTFRRVTSSLNNSLPTAQSTVRTMVTSDSNRLYNSFHPAPLSGSYPSHKSDVHHSQQFISNVTNAAYQTTSSSSNKNIPPLIHAGTYKQFGYPTASQTFPQQPFTRQNLSAGFDKTEKSCQERINAIPPERMIAVPPERMSYPHPSSNVHNVQYQHPLQMVPQNVVVKPSPIVQQNVIGAQTVQHHANCHCINCVRHHHNCGCVQCLTEKARKKDVCSHDNRKLDMRDYDYTKVYKSQGNLSTTAQYYPKQQPVVCSCFPLKPNTLQSRQRDLSPLTSTYPHSVQETSSFKPLSEPASYKPVTSRESLSHLSQLESPSMHLSSSDIQPSLKNSVGLNEREELRDNVTKTSVNCLDLSVSSKSSECDAPLDLTVPKCSDQPNTSQHRENQPLTEAHDISVAMRSQNVSDVQKHHYSQLYTEAASSGFSIKCHSSTEFQNMERNCQDMKVIQTGDNVTNRNSVYRPSSNHRSPSATLNVCDSVQKSQSQIPVTTAQHSNPHLSEDAPFPIPMKVATQCLSPDVSPLIQPPPQTSDASNNSSRTPTPSGLSDKKDSNASRRGSISKHEPIQNILGTNLPSDVLYLICRLCGQTYGSPYGFRKHFRNQHGFEPRAEHTIVQTISATKSAMKVQESGPDVIRHVDERADLKGVTDITLSPTVHSFSLDIGKPKEMEYSGRNNQESEEGISTFNQLQQTLRNSSENSDINVNKSEETKCLQCPECQQTFQLNDFGSYKRHCRQHNNTKSIGILSCPDCHVTFQDSFELKEHMLSHTPDYCRCKVCSLTFTSSKCLQEHLKTAHPVDSVKTTDSMITKVSMSHLVVSPDSIIRSSDINRQPADQIGAISASPDSSTPQEYGNSNESKEKRLPSCISDTVISVAESVQDSKEICLRQRSEAADTGSAQEMNTDEVKKYDSENSECSDIAEPVYKHKKFSLPRKRHDLTTSVDAPPQKMNCVSSSDNVCRNSSSFVDSTQCISGSEKLNVHSSPVIVSDGDSQHKGSHSVDQSCDSVDVKYVKMKSEDEPSLKNDSDRNVFTEITKYPNVHTGKLKYNGADIKQEARHNMPYVWDRITRTQAGKPIKPPDYM